MRITVAIMASTAIYASAHASIVVTTNKDEWLGTATPVTALDFTDLALLEFVTDQYADLGVMFFGTAIGHTGMSLYPSDGHGILGWTHQIIEMEFDAPRTEFAIELGSGSMVLTFYLGGAEVGIANVSRFTSIFWGVFAESGFDRVTLEDQGLGGTAADNIYFGAPIPAPGALVLVTFAGLVSRRRRRA